MTSREGEARAAWPGALVVRDPDALLAAPEVDMVVVATPNHTHAPIARTPSISKLVGSGAPSVTVPLAVRAWT